MAVILVLNNAQNGRKTEGMRLKTVTFNIVRTFKNYCAYDIT